MTVKSKQEAQNPLILRCHRLVEAFAKSDDERDFYLDKTEGFLLYCNLDKSEEELQAFEGEIKSNNQRYWLIPKLSFYETKKIMEGFVNEKVYDIDTKEKLLDIISSKEARENFLEFINDHHTEFEKWQQFYLERSRIRIIEWLRANHFHFVFEEDLDIPVSMIEKLKRNLFESKVSKDVAAARKLLATKAKSYYSNEALNPRPKRGRPPKQAVKMEVEPQFAMDVYLTLSLAVRPFLFSPESSANTSTFSAKFDTDDDLSTQRRVGGDEATIGNISQQLSALRGLSTRWSEREGVSSKPKAGKDVPKSSFDEDEEEEDSYSLNGVPAKASEKKSVASGSKRPPAKAPVKTNKAPIGNSKSTATKKAPSKSAPSKSAAASKTSAKKPAPAAKAKSAAKPKAKEAAKPPVKKGGLRSILKSKAPAKGKAGSKK